jgi:hypothetical protein
MQTIEQCQEESRKHVWDHTPGVFRERFVSPYEQYADRIGQKFAVVKQTQELAPDADEPQEDMYLIRFEDGTEITAWGIEVCVEAK